MNCQAFHELIGTFLEHSLSDKDIREFEDHRGQCPACRSELEKTLQTVQRLKGFYGRLSAAQPTIPPLRLASTGETPVANDSGFLFQIRNWLAHVTRIPRLSVAFLLLLILAGSALFWFKGEGPSRQTFSPYSWVLSEHLAATTVSGDTPFRQANWMLAVANASIVMKGSTGTNAIMASVRKGAIVSLTPEDLLLYRGQMEFEKRDSSLDFRIQTPHVQLRLVGMKLSVSVSGDRTSVTLEQGIVLASREQETIRMQAGQHLQFGPHGVLKSESERPVNPSETATNTLNASSTTRQTATRPAVLGASGVHEIPREPKTGSLSVSLATTSSAVTTENSSDSTRREVATDSDIPNPGEVFLHD